MSERPEGVAGDIAAIKADLDRIVGPLVQALKRDRALDDLQARLRTAEKVGQAWRDWPLLTGVHDTILGLRDAGEASTIVTQQLEDLLFRVGVEEFGLEGELVDPGHVEILEVTGEGPDFRVNACRRPGLRLSHVPLRKAIVSVIRENRSNA